MTDSGRNIETWADLEAWVDRRLLNIELDLAEDETMQSARMQLMERRAVLLDLRLVITPAVEDEAFYKAAMAEEERADAEAKEELAS